MRPTQFQIVYLFPTQSATSQEKREAVVVFLHTSTTTPPPTPLFVSFQGTVPFLYAPYETAADAAVLGFCRGETHFPGRTGESLLTGFAAESSSSPTSPWWLFSLDLRGLPSPLLFPRQHPSANEALLTFQVVDLALILL
ncbi:hypothetical protein SRHO_G00113670 [Serrasalmus rhombeus]